MSSAWPCSPRRRWKTAWCAALAATIVLVNPACGHVDSSAPSHIHVRLTSGTPGASFYPLGQLLARAYAERLPDLVFEVRASGGSVSNVDAIQQGTADIGFSYADVAYGASAGGRGSEPRSADRVTAIAVLGLTPLHFVVRSGSGVQTVADLRGRRVNLGPHGSGTALTASLVLHAFGIDAEQVRVESLAHNDAAAKLVAGSIDAMFVGASYPAESVRAAANRGARVLSVTGPEIDRLRSEYPFFRMMLIPPGTYAGHAATVRTIGVDTVLVCRADLDEVLVYRLTKAFFEALPTVAAEQPWLQSIDFDQAPATPIPLHVGATRYYRERELAR